MYNMVVVNDNSTDRTLEVIQETLELLPQKIRNKITVINNTENHGAVYNQITNIRKYNDDRIIMLLDGDDSLINDSNIFHKYNNLYHDGAEFTYGSCWSMADNIPLIAQEYPPFIKQMRLYKDYKFNWNMPYTHLRTFTRRLLDNVHDYEFKSLTGTWYKAGGDNAVFYAILQNANPEKVICVPEVVYNYNDVNPLNDYKVNSSEQTKNSKEICGETKSIDMET